MDQDNLRDRRSTVGAGRWERPSPWNTQKGKHCHDGIRVRFLVSRQLISLNEGSHQGTISVPGLALAQRGFGMSLEAGQGSESFRRTLVPSGQP